MHGRQTKKRKTVVSLEDNMKRWTGKKIIDDTLVGGVTHAWRFVTTDLHYENVPVSDS